MTSAPAELGYGTWSPFRLVTMPGVKAGRVDSNIYIFNVQTWGDRLLALFPAVFPAAGSAGLYASTSLDGVDWARPQRLLKTPALCARTRVHPVRLVGEYLYVLSNIDISEPMDVPEGRTHVRGSTRPYLQRVRVDIDQPDILGMENRSVTFRTDAVRHAGGLVAPTSAAAALSRFRTPTTDSVSDMR